GLAAADRARRTPARAGDPEGAADASGGTGPPGHGRQRRADAGEVDVTSKDASEQDFEGLGDAHFAHTTGNQTVVFQQENRRLRSLRERQWALLIVCLGTFMTAVDGSAVYVALPSIQSDLGFAPA